MAADLRPLAEQLSGGVKWGSNGEGQIHCPFHDDQNPSCSINVGKNTFVCHACGEKGTLVSLLNHCGIPVPAKEQAQIAYDYRDASGKLRYQVVRYYKNGKKEFYCRRPDGAGGWITKGAMKGVKRLPYRLPELRDSKEILIVEGEKCVEALRSWNYVATCNSEGAGKWRPELNKYFPKGAKIYLIPDADEPGQAHMEKVGQALLSRGCVVFWVELGYPIKEKHGKDIADWLPNHSREDLERKLSSALEFESKEEPEEIEEKECSPAGQLEFTDVANAERFFREYGDRVRYCTVAKSWFYWNGKVWKEDNNQIIAAWAKKTAKKMYDAAWEEQDKKLAKWALSSQSRTKIDSMLALGKSEETIPILPEDMDTDSYLWNCSNGFMDLRNIGFLQPHNREMLITKISAVPFDDAAKCPRWDQFVLEIMSGSQDLVDFLRRMAGYCMTGDMSEQKYFTLWGPGQNGKTVFLETLLRVWGDYAATALTDTFLRRKSENVQHDIARLRGARIVCISETGQGSNLDEELVKQWVGQDTLSGRFLYARRAFDFKPVGKLIIRTNYKPIIKGQDAGIWRKSLLIKFGEKFEGGREDKHLEEKLFQELPGILRWCLVGCAEWKGRGLDPPPEVQSAVKEYKEDMDELADFFSEYCVFDPAAKIENARLYELYRRWCEDAGIKKPLNRVWFGRELSNRGYEKDRDSGGRYRLGIGEK